MMQLEEGVDLIGTTPFEVLNTNLPAGRYVIFVHLSLKEIFFNNNTSSDEVRISVNGTPVMHINVPIGSDTHPDTMSSSTLVPLWDLTDPYDPEVPLLVEVFKSVEASGDPYQNPVGYSFWVYVGITKL